MTGKELILVLAGLGAAAGAAGMTAAMVDGGSDGGDRSAEILERIDDLGRSIEKNRKSSERVERQVEHLADRVQDLENRKLEATAAPGRVVPAVTPDASDPMAAAEAAMRQALEDHEALKAGKLPNGSTSGPVVFGPRGEGLPKHLEGLRERMGDSFPEDLGRQLEEALGELGEIEVEGVQLGSMLGGFRKGLELRRLPEAERWDKARADVGLADYQVESLKTAVAERDAAMKEATITDTQTTDSGARLSFSRIDPVKARTAREDYDRKVSETLNDQQRKSWRDGGYDNAFGGSGPMGMGSGVIVTTTSTHEVRDGVDQQGGE